MTSAADHAATVREAVGSAISWGVTHGIRESPDYDRWRDALAALVALADRATELEREREEQIRLTGERASLLTRYQQRAERAERERDELAVALQAYNALFCAWEGRDSLTLSPEAIQQWRSIARAALGETAPPRNPDPEGHPATDAWRRLAP